MLNCLSTVAVQVNVLNSNFDGTGTVSTSYMISIVNAVKMQLTNVNIISKSINGCFAMAGLANLSVCDNVVFRRVLDADSSFPLFYLFCTYSPTLTINNCKFELTNPATAKTLARAILSDQSYTLALYMNFCLFNMAGLSATEGNIVGGSSSVFFINAGSYAYYGSTKRMTATLWQAVPFTS